MKSITKKEPSKLTLGANLYVVQMEIAKLEEREKELKAQLLDNLKKQGVKGVKLENDVWYIRAQRTTLKAKSGDTHEMAARKWAEKNNCLKIDSDKAWRILKPSLNPLPEFFQRKDTEFLTIKRPGMLDESAS